MIAGLVLLALLAAPGCAFKAGPGEDGWLTFQIWTQANLMVETPVGDLCLGCLEAGDDPDVP